MFTDRPVTELSQLYGEGHKEAVKTLRDNVEKGKFTVVLGSRRVGKTSVVRTFLNHYKYPYVYFDLSPYIGYSGVSYTSLAPAIVGFEDRKLSSEGQINLGIVRFSFRVSRGAEFENAIVNLFREVNEKFDRFVVVVDEAQVLPFVRGINFLGLLQMVHNTMDNVVVVMTGSMPGILERMLSPSSKRPMFARHVEKISVDRWSREECIKYLEEGFKKEGVEYELEELYEASEELSRVPGFLALYGLQRVSGKAHHEALSDAEERAISLWQGDLEAFLNLYDSPTYVHALWVLSQTAFGMKWGELMRELGRIESISRPKLSRVLKNLIAAGMVEKREDKYYVAERPLRKAVLKSFRLVE